MSFDNEMMQALMADGETLRQMTGEDHGPWCPTCGANAPHLHPAVQFEGEVEVCSDAFHLVPTPQNTSEFIAAVEAKRAAKAAS